MRLPEKFARQEERTQYKQRFADWTLRLAAHYEENDRTTRRGDVESLLREGVDLLNEIIEKDHRELLESCPLDPDNTFADEFKICLTALLPELGETTGQTFHDGAETDGLTAEVHGALEKLDCYREP